MNSINSVLGSDSRSHKIKRDLLALIWALESSKKFRALAWDQACTCSSHECFKSWCASVIKQSNQDSNTISNMNRERSLRFSHRICNCSVAWPRARLSPTQCTQVLPSWCSPRARVMIREKHTLNGYVRVKLAIQKLYTKGQKITYGNGINKSSHLLNEVLLCPPFRIGGGFEFHDVQHHHCKRLRWSLEGSHTIKLANQIQAVFQQIRSKL